MYHSTGLLTLLSIWAAALSPASCVTNLTLTPAQVLLPSTSFYRAPNSKEIIKIHVQVLLRVEPRVCVNWEAQNPELLRLFPPNNEENYFDYATLPASGFVEGCSSSIWAASVPNLTPGAFPGSGDQLRSWVFSFDASTKSRAGAEVIISPMKSIQFETRNRRIAVNQIATLKIVGHDQFDNTFTSLEGIPFEARIEDPSIMQIIDPRNDPEAATRARISLLDKKDRFAVSAGYSLTSDLIVLQGKKVGRTKISVRVMLPEYKEIVLQDVEFTVSESIDLEPSRLVLPPGTSFQFCVHKIKPQSAMDDSWDSQLNYSNYTWAAVGGTGHVIKPDGTLNTGKTGSADFRVVLTDKRNSEMFASEVSLRVPSKLSVSYGPIQDMLDCFATKGLDLPDIRNMPEGKIVALLHKEVYRNCRGNMHCGGRHLTGGVNAKPLAYLLMGRSYMFDTSMRDSDDVQIYVPEASRFAWNVKEDGILTVEMSSNGRFAAVRANREGSSTIVISMGSPRVAMEISVSVTNPVYVAGFPVETIRWPDAATGKQATIAASVKPLIVPINENVKMLARGGSGEYTWHLDDANLCNVKQGVLRCQAYGTTVMTLADKLNPENIFKVQVITKQIRKLASVPSSLHVEVGTSAQIKVQGYTDISDVIPVFSDSWDAGAEGYGQFYSCMVFNYMADRRDRKLNCRIEHDQFLLDVSKSIEEPFSCGVFSYRALHSGESQVSVTLMDEEKIESSEITAGAKVTIYDRLGLVIHPDYTQRPFKNAPEPFMNVSQGTTDKAVFANVAIGGKIRLVATGGPPMHEDHVTLAACETGASSLYIEKVSTEGMPGTIRTIFDVYCLSETAGETMCMNVEGSLRNSYTISCRLPSYVEIHPLVPASNKGVYDSLMDYSGSRLNWDNEQIPGSSFTTGANLCQKDDSKTFWQVKLNAEEYHAFRAVVFDAFGNPLAPTHNFRTSWRGSAITANVKPEENAIQTIDNSMFIYKSGDLMEKELVAQLEWPDSFDTRHTSAKFSSLMKPRAVTTLINSNQMWQKSADRRGVHVLSFSLKLLPTLPHEILIGTGKTAFFGTEKRVSVFFNPRLRYQFAVVLGSGNYVELSAYTEAIKLQHSGTVTFASAEEFSKAVKPLEGMTNLFNPLCVKKHLETRGQIATVPIPVKYMNFFCTNPCSRTMEIVDRTQLGQVTKSLFISQAHVAKLSIVITEIGDEEFEDFDALSTLQGGLQLLTVKRHYRLHAVAVDANGIPMSYASLKDVKFSVCSNTLVKLQQPKDLGYNSVGSTMMIQCLAEGRYTITADIQNYKGNSDVANGSVVTATLEITAYKETKPMLGSMLLLPNSPEFQVAMLDRALTRPLPNQKVVLQSSGEDVLKVVNSAHWSYLSSLSTGSCELTSYIPSGDSIQSKSVTPVTVAVPHAVEVTVPGQVLSGSAVVLHANLTDKNKKIFTPLFIMGAQESEKRSFCSFTWNLNGHGTLVDGASRVPTVIGVGKSRVTLVTTSAGPVTINVHVLCRNLGPQSYIELSTKVTIDSVVPMKVFGSGSISNVILATESTYESQAGLVEVIASAGQELLSIQPKGIIKTKNKIGHVLLKTADNYVSHVQVMKVDQVQIHSGPSFTGEFTVMKSGVKQLEVYLRTRDGQLIVPPVDLKLNAMVSNASLFRVTTSGHKITLSANNSEGCSCLMVFLEDNDEQYIDGNLVVDLVKVCVSNALTPQQAAVLKGSEIRFMAGDTRLYSIQLRGIPLAKRYAKMEYQGSLQYFQDALSPVLESVVNDLRNELSRALFKVLRDMNIAEETVNNTPQFYMPVLEASQHKGLLKPVYIFPFSVSGDLDSSVFMAKLTSLLQEFARNGDSILSLMEAGITPLCETKTDGWSADDLGTISIKDAQALALQAGKALVRYEGPHMKGDSSVTVYDQIARVQLQLTGLTGALKASFPVELKHQELHSPFYIAFKAIAHEGQVLKNSLQIDSKLLPVCEFTGNHSWLNDVFMFEPTFLPFGATEFLPACRASIRILGGAKEWSSLKNTLKNTSEPGSGIKLRLALYSTLPMDLQSSALTSDTLKPVTEQEHLLVTLRNSDLKLWENEFAWRAPMFANFVDASGASVEQLSIDNGNTAQLSVYPHYANCSLAVDNMHYQLRVTEKQGMLCSFTLDNDGTPEPATVKLMCNRNVIATLSVSNSSATQRRAPTVNQTQTEHLDYKTDIFLALFTAAVAGAFAYLVYSLLHRPASGYHDTSEPIKIERSMPNVFDKLYQTDYHGSYAPATAQYQHRRRHPRS